MEWLAASTTGPSLLPPNESQPEAPGTGNASSPPHLVVSPQRLSMAEDTTCQWLRPIQPQEPAGRRMNPSTLPILEPKVPQNQHRICGKCCRTLRAGEYCRDAVACCHCCGCRQHGKCTPTPELSHAPEADHDTAAQHARQNGYYMPSLSSSQSGAGIDRAAPDGMAKAFVSADSSARITPLDALAIQASSTEAGGSSQPPAGQQWAPVRPGDNTSPTTNSTDRTMSLLSEDLAVSFRRRFEGGYTLSPDAYPPAWPRSGAVDRDIGPDGFSPHDRDGQNIRLPSLAEVPRRWPLADRGHVAGTEYGPRSPDEHLRKRRNAYVPDSAGDFSSDWALLPFDPHPYSLPEVTLSPFMAPQSSFDSWASAGWETTGWPGQNLQHRSSTIGDLGRPPTPPRLPLPLPDSEGVSGVVAAAEDRDKGQAADSRVYHPVLAHTYRSPAALHGADRGGLAG